MKEKEGEKKKEKERVVKSSAANEPVAYIIRAQSRDTLPLTKNLACVRARARACATSYIIYLG